MGAVKFKTFAFPFSRRYVTQLAAAINPPLLPHTHTHRVMTTTECYWNTALYDVTRLLPPRAAICTTLLLPRKYSAPCRSGCLLLTRLPGCCSLLPVVDEKRVHKILSYEFRLLSGPRFSALLVAIDPISLHFSLSVQDILVCVFFFIYIVHVISMIWQFCIHYFCIANMIYPIDF